MQMSDGLVWGFALNAHYLTNNGVEGKNGPVFQKCLVPMRPCIEGCKEPKNTHEELSICAKCGVFTGPDM